jgi:hypothetical protein
MTNVSGKVEERADGAGLVLGKANYNEKQLGVCFGFPNRVKIDVLLTYQCNAACAHCITDSNPYRREWLGQSEILNLLRAGREFGKVYVSFTGGEPFLKIPLLETLVRGAKALGYYVASDTNAGWARTPKMAQQVVDRMMAAGLDAIFPSADPYHLPYISLSCVENVIIASDNAGLTCEVNFCPGPDSDQNAEILRRLGLEERGFFCDGLSLTGRDVTSLHHCFPQRGAEEITDIGSMHFGISPRGDCFANVDISYECREFVGTPFELGNVRRDGPKTLIEREAKDPLLALMRTWSPAETHGFLTTHGDLGPRYQGLVEGKRYFSATEYWLELFHSSLNHEIINVLRRLGVRDTGAG